MTDVHSRHDPEAAGWSRIRARLAALEDLDENSSALSAGDARAVLEERARLLAVPVGGGREDYLSLVQVGLADETYAVESHFVFEAYRSAGMALLPGAEPPVVGLTAWRGELLTLLDLRQIMGLPPSSAAERAQILVLGTHAPAFGVLVDEVRGIMELSGSLLPPEKEEPRGNGRFLQRTTAEAVLVIAAADLIQSFS